MKKLIEVGGASFLIPFVLSGVVLYLSRGWFGWLGHKAQNRKEFLELWDDARARDALWMEVAVRHLVGIYLPAHVIRLALSQPDRAQSLLELADLWPLWRYDREARAVRWAHFGYRSLRFRRAIRYGQLAMYFVGMGYAIGAGALAMEYGPRTIYGWALGASAAMALTGALLIAWRLDVIDTAIRSGDAWIETISRSVEGDPRENRQDADVPFIGQQLEIRGDEDTD